MLEDIPRQGSKLADELREVGADIKKQAEEGTRPVLSTGSRWCDTDRVLVGANG